MTKQFENLLPAGRCCRPALLLVCLLVVCFVVLLTLVKDSPDLYPYRMLYNKLGFSTNPNTRKAVVIDLTRSDSDHTKSREYSIEIVDSDGDVESTGADTLDNRLLIAEKDLTWIEQNWPIRNGQYAFNSSQIHVLRLQSAQLPPALAEFSQIVGHPPPLLLVDIPILNYLLASSNRNNYSQSNASFLQVTFALSNFSSSAILNEWCSSEWNCSSDNNSTTFDTGQLSVRVIHLEERPNYWYFPMGLNNEYQASGFLPFPISVLFFEKTKYYLPANITAFLEWSARSHFIECNRTSAALLLADYADVKPSISQLQFDQMVYLRDLLYGLDVHPFLFGGTALGWYRQCGLVPDTTDLDLAVRASQYSKALVRTLSRDTVLRLHWMLGLPNDSLELSVIGQSVKIDLFFLYGEKDHSWVGGMLVGKRKKLKWTYPKLHGLCSGDLKGHLFLVPCNSVEFLIADYGPQFYIPLHDDAFVWYNSHKNVRDNGYWPISQWASVYRTRFW